MPSGFGKRRLYRIMNKNSQEATVYDHENTQAQARALRDEVLGILSSHVGADSAITAGDIAARLGRVGRYADRPVREAIKQLRRGGYLILSSVGDKPGYFLAADKQEWLSFRDGNLRPRALDILKTAQAMGEAAGRQWGGAEPLAQLELELVA